MVKKIFLKIWNFTVSSIIFYKLRLFHNKTNLEMPELIIFSFDRPSQLFVLLKSIENFFDPIPNCIHIIYRFSDKKFLDEYQRLFLMFSHLSIRPVLESFFSTDLKRIISSVKSSRVMFLVDDQVIFRKINLNNNEIYNSDVYTFRIGQRTNYSYTLDLMLAVPQFVTKGNSIYWNCGFRRGDFNYPLSLDTTIIPTSIVSYGSKYLIYSAPNSLEGAYNQAKILAKLFGVSIGAPKKQAAVNMVLNRVQNENSNRSLVDYDVSTLLELWKKDKVYQLDHKVISSICSPHIDYGFYLSDIKN